jgi:23S rRNA (pseudouridine1915-N3)-methyltransferase
MRLAVIAIGRRGPRWLQEALTDYVRRLPAAMRIELIEIAPVRRGRNADSHAATRTEAARLRAAVPANHIRVALDERGRQIDTKFVATQLQGWRDEDRNVAFLIGGADGLDPALVREANAAWSMSKLTLPHGIARLLLVEQLYRGWTVLSGHPYHRE